MVQNPYFLAKPTFYILPRVFIFFRHGFIFYRGVFIFLGTAVSIQSKKVDKCVKEEPLAKCPPRKAPEQDSYQQKMPSRASGQGSPQKRLQNKTVINRKSLPEPLARVYMVLRDFSSKHLQKTKETKGNPT